MIIPDVNLLIHTYNTDSARHDRAREWWESVLNGSAPVGLPWASMLGFIRITTHRQVLTRPLSVATACGHVRAWLAQPGVSVIDPGQRHAEILFRLLDAIGTAGNLTTDAHLAALAIEHDAELHSTDADFARFPSLRWTDPLRDD